LAFEDASALRSAHDTLVVCCNSDGSDMLPLWFTRNSKKPRCLKTLNLNDLGCYLPQQQEKSLAEDLQLAVAQVEATAAEDVAAEEDLVDQKVIKDL
jgi:hypothetical protein